MYESQYNYYPEENNENLNNHSNSKKKKTALLILSTILLSGASGFGGAYAMNTINANSTIVSTETQSTISSSASTSTASLDNSTLSKQNITSSLNSYNNGSLTTKQIVNKVSPSVVSIRSEVKTQGETQSATGTGIIFSTDGYIITNAHVVQSEVTEYVQEDSSPFKKRGYDAFDFFFEGGYGSYQTVTKNADKITVVLSSDDSEEFEATIIGADTNSDIAVLKIDPGDTELIAAEFGNSDDLTMGDKAVAIGYPLGLGLSTSEGIISGLNRTLDVELSAGGSASMTLIQTDAAINPGNSGGPLINDKGQVIGITSSKLVDSSVEGLGFAIPISDAMPLISDLMNQGYVTDKTPMLGITGTNITNAVARYYGLPVEKGVMVVSVSENSGAADAGIQEGDVIIAVDGKEISNMDDLTKSKNNKEIGDTITVTLARAKENEDVTITLKGESESNKN